MLIALGSARKCVYGLWLQYTYQESKIYYQEYEYVTPCSGSDGVLTSYRCRGLCDGDQMESSDLLKTDQGIETSD